MMEHFWENSSQVPSLVVYEKRSIVDVDRVLSKPQSQEVRHWENGKFNGTTKISKSMNSFWCFYCKISTYFAPFFWCFKFGLWTSKYQLGNLFRVIFVYILYWKFPDHKFLLKTSNNCDTDCKNVVCWYNNLLINQFF